MFATIAWAREQTVSRSARPVLHFGALLATFPFVGAVARVIGQHLQTEGSVETSVVKAEVRRSLGDRSSVDVATRKTYTTLVNLGLLGIQSGTLVPRPIQLRQTPAIQGWLVHAVLATRRAGAITSASAAVELLAPVAPLARRSYPGLQQDGDVLVAANPGWSVRSDRSRFSE